MSPIGLAIDALSGSVGLELRVSARWDKTSLVRPARREGRRTAKSSWMVLLLIGARADFGAYAGLNRREAG